MADVIPIESSNSASVAELNKSENSLFYAAISEINEVPRRVKFGQRFIIYFLMLVRIIWVVIGCKMVSSSVVPGPIPNG